MASPQTLQEQALDQACQTVLFVALELSDKKWKLALSDGNKKRIVTIAAGDLVTLGEAIAKAKARLWDARGGAHRELLRGRARWLLAASLFGALWRGQCGGGRLEYRSEPASPPGQDGSGGCGAALAPADPLPSRGKAGLERGARAQCRGRRCSTVAPGIRATQEGAQVRREDARLRSVDEQIRTLEAEQVRRLEAAPPPCHQQVAHLMRLRGIGLTSAWVFVMEYFGWRQFNNRKEVAALAGLTPMPYASGDSARDQGISKAGNRRIRSLMIQIAWGWLRYQPHSALSVWFNTRFALGGKRMRRIGIVALARRLLIALWRYVQSGAIPEGASLKPL